jgi:hypothetical protein
VAADFIQRLLKPAVYECRTTDSEQPSSDTKAFESATSISDHFVFTYSALPIGIYRLSFIIPDLANRSKILLSAIQEHNWDISLV